MTRIPPDQLLEGPRGRRLCLEVATAAGQAAGDAGQDARGLLFWAATRADPGYGTPAVSVFGPGAAEPHPDPSPEEVAAALLALPAPTVMEEAVLVEALEQSVGSARYWQEPDGYDVIAAHPALGASLSRAAAAIADSGLADWWADPVDGRAQRRVTPLPAPDVPQDRRTVAEALLDWRRGLRCRPPGALAGDPEHPSSGEWWSPPLWGPPKTTRELPGGGSVGIRLIEDRLGWERFAVAPMTPPGGPVAEIGGPGDWAALCERFPIDVTGHRHSDWRRTTGVDRIWILPDYQRLATEFAGVHVSVLGYLRTAGRPIELGEGRATVLAGWDPDATVWLRDGLTQAGAAIEWVQRGDGWTPDRPS